MKFMLWMALGALLGCAVSCIRFGVVALIECNPGLACGFFVWPVIAVVVGYFVFDLQREGG